MSNNEKKELVKQEDLVTEDTIKDEKVIDGVAIEDEVVDTIDDDTSDELLSDEEKAKTAFKVAPKIFMKRDQRIKIEVVGFYDLESGELSFVLPKTDDIFNDLTDTTFGHPIVHEFIFKNVTYDKLNRYRNGSMIYNREDKNNTINLVQLRDYFLVFHLVDWNYTDEDGEKIGLTFDINGALSDDSLALVYSLPASILDLVFSIFEKRINLIV